MLEINSLKFLKRLGRPAFLKGGTLWRLLSVVEQSPIHTGKRAIFTRICFPRIFMNHPTQRPRFHSGGCYGAVPIHMPGNTISISISPRSRKADGWRRLPGCRSIITNELQLMHFLPQSSQELLYASSMQNKRRLLMMINALSLALVKLMQLDRRSSILMQIAAECVHSSGIEPFNIPSELTVIEAFSYRIMKFFRLQKVIPLLIRRTSLHLSLQMIVALNLPMRRNMSQTTELSRHSLPANQL
ncbi:hypothetical protein DSECCO2_428710 [anaerobic digester metagenome]